MLLVGTEGYAEDAWPGMDSHHRAEILDIDLSATELRAEALLKLFRFIQDIGVHYDDLTQLPAFDFVPHHSQHALHAVRPRPRGGERPGQ